MARSCSMNASYSGERPGSSPGPGRRATKCPRFSVDTTTPSPRSTSSPCRTVMAATPYCLASSRSAGSWSPTWYRPEAIAARRSSAICRYAGRWPRRGLTATGQRYRSSSLLVLRRVELPAHPHLCSTLLYSKRLAARGDGPGGPVGRCCSTASRRGQRTGPVLGGLDAPPG
jgi:hypothetical protein